MGRSRIRILREEAKKLRGSIELPGGIKISRRKAGAGVVILYVLILTDILSACLTMLLLLFAGATTFINTNLATIFLKISLLTFGLMVVINGFIMISIKVIEKTKEGEEDVS